TRVDRGVQEDLDEVVGIDPGAQGGADVHVEFVLVADRGEDREGQQPACAVVQTRTRPDVSPGGAGDEILEGPGEFGGRLDGPVDVCVAEDGSAYPQALFERRGAVCG